jgi:ATP-dependent metalloprotease FtsH
MCNFLNIKKTGSIAAVLIMLALYCQFALPTNLSAGNLRTYESLAFENLPVQSVINGIPFDFTQNSLSGIILLFAAIIIVSGYMLFMDCIPRKKEAVCQEQEVFMTPVSVSAANPGCNFSSVAGCEETKEEMRCLVDFLKNPQRYTDMGAKLPKGIVFYGPPGTGKTLMAKAIAGEADVPFFAVSGSDFIEKYVGVGAKRVRELFSKARKSAPCIIFIDEIDCVGGVRNNESNEERYQTVNALLSEMDGFSGREGIIIIAATNRLDILDEALIRPGRFDRHTAISLPDKKDRQEILKVHARNKKINKDVSLEEIAKLTVGFSGAGLESLLNEAAILAVNHNKTEITREEIDDAFFKIIVKGDKKKNRKDHRQEEVNLVAWHEAGHALVTKLLTDNEVPTVTIIPTTSGFGGATFRTPKKEGLLSKRDLFNDVKITYGGRIAEKIFFGNDYDITTGASNDIRVATQQIRRIINDYGMSDTFGMVNLNELAPDKSNQGQIEEAIKLSKKLYDETEVLLKFNVAVLKAIAEALIENETLNETELDKIICREKYASAVTNNDRSSVS